MSLLAIFALFIVLGLVFYEGEDPENNWTEAERKAGLGYRFANNFLTVFLGLPGGFFFVVGILKATVSTSPTVRSEGPWWILTGVVLLATLAFLHKKVLSKWLIRSEQEHPPVRAAAPQEPQPPRKCCGNCTFFECTAWLDKTKGTCKKHQRKTLAYEVCENHQWKVET